MEHKTAFLQVARRLTIPLLKLALCSVLWASSGSRLHAEAGGYELATKLIPNVVQIRTKWIGKAQIGGFGFIIGERDGLLYIATANHVVRGNGPGEIDPTPTVLFSSFQGASYPSKLLETSSETADLAVITIETAKIPHLDWTRDALSAASAVAGVTDVWFVKFEQKWLVPRSPGTVSNVTEVKRNEYSGATIVVDGLRITVGTSGAPLISDDGIVGMIVSDSNEQKVEAIPIDRIEAIIRGWGHPWQLAVISPKQNCDRLAASPYDNDRPADVVGVDLDDLDSDKALSACLWPFMKYSGKIPRFAFQMGRAREAAKRSSEAEVGYLAAADRGYAAAQSSLGVLYERKNKEQDAANLYRRAADQGDPVGQTNLGTMLRDGYGVLAKDDVAAVDLYKKAASQNYPAALSCLAWMYEQGRGGLPKSVPDAERLYRQAAAKGDPYAQRALARLDF